MAESTTTATLSAEQIVAAIRRGERAAEHALVAKYSRGVMHMIRRHAPEYAEEVHQDTFRAVLERLRRDGIEEPGQLERYIVRTAKNTLQNVRRSVSRAALGVEPELIAEHADEGPGPFERLSREELAMYVRRVLGELGTPRDRAILQRFYIEEIDKERICAELGLDAVHFNRVLHRARERFRELVVADNIHFAEFGHES